MSLHDNESIKQHVFETDLFDHDEKRRFERLGNRHANELAIQQWGWSSPPEEILDLALLSIQLQSMNDIDALVKLGLLDSKTKQYLLKNKPEDQQSLEWLWLNQPSLREDLNKTMTLRAGVQYFDDLLRLGIVVHPDMKKDALRRYCESKRCALGLIEGTTAVLCFGKYDDLDRFRMVGRSERNEVLSLITIILLH